jgi:NAD(P) transhydrogenase subunit alpha
MYANNLAKLLALLVTKDGILQIDVTDEVIAGCLVCHKGSVVHPRVRELLAATTPKRQSTEHQQ